MELKTNRLILREFVADDFLSVHAYASNIENVKYMIWGPNDEKDTESFINDCIQWQNISPRMNYDFAITLRITGQLIGGCGIYLENGLNPGKSGMDFA